VFRIKSLKLLSGATIQVADGLTAIVGPNNAGKSLLLRELFEHINRMAGTPPNVGRKVLDGFEAEFDGSVDEFIEHLTTQYEHKPPGTYDGIGTQYESHFLVNNGSILLDSMVQLHWDSQDGLGPIAPVLCLYMGAESRLGMASNGQSFNLLRQSPTIPAQALYADRSLEAKVSELMHRAFNDGLVVNRYAGSEIILHVGSVGSTEEMPPSDEYLQEISDLPQLVEQGDGMRAFLGILLSIITGSYSLVIVDEPEAFLHPPQAALLGRVLAEQHDNGTQVIISTHSQEIVEGITSSKGATSNVSLVRLTRNGTINHPAQVSAEELGELFRDPLIKYYSILNGLFSQGTVLCEGDSDCTYFRAVLDSVGQLDDGREASSVSVHFTHCGGKARISRAARALRSARVPTFCIVDADLLQDVNEFNDLIVACGGDPTEVSAHRNVIVSSISSASNKLLRSTVSRDINEILDGKKQQDLSSSDAAKIRLVATPQSGWKEFKKFGRKHLLGEVLTAFNELDKKIRALGIFMVHDGELESFHPEVSRTDKAAWLRKVLEAEMYKTSDEAQRFVKDLMAAIVAQQ
jgi:hypothetical protein